MTVAKKNIYGKLADAREEFHGLKLEKTGRNKFAGYNYFELGDFLIPAMQCLKNHGLVTLPVSFSDDLATLEVRELDGDGQILTNSPMRDAQLKGCHPIQNLGAVETYQRRYLWVSLMEIVEHDALDSAQPLGDDKPKTAAPKKKVTKKVTKKVVPIQEDKFKVFNIGNAKMEIPDAEGATFVTDAMIQLVTEMHSDSMENLVSFWKNNGEIISYLQENYVDEFTRLKNVFTEIKTTLIGDSQ